MKIICLHGIGQTGQAWKQVMDLLPEQELVALDLFENGRLPEDYQHLVAKVRGLWSLNKKTLSCWVCLWAPV